MMSVTGCAVRSTTQGARQGTAHDTTRCTLNGATLSPSALPLAP